MVLLYRYFVKPALSLYTKVSGQALVYENGQKSCMNAAYRFSQCLEHRNQVFPLEVYLPTVERHMDLGYMSEMFLLSSLIIPTVERLMDLGYMSEMFLLSSLINVF